MKSQNQFITITTLHDPESRMIPMIQQVLPALMQLCPQIIIVCTQETTEKCVETIRIYGGSPFHNRGVGYVKNYQLAVEKGLEIAQNGEKLFYCDFDRLLHWYQKYPQELAKLLEKKVEVDLILIGRTPRAFATHPITQTATESLINQIGSKILNFDSPQDVIVASWICNQQLAKRLLQLKTISKTGFYVFWPVMLWLWASQRQYIEMEGQEWETPDRYLSEIQKIGFLNWMDQWQNAEEWQKRTAILRDCMDELNTIIQIKVKQEFN